jgi:hypothetical protein
MSASASGRGNLVIEHKNLSPMMVSTCLAVRYRNGSSSSRKPPFTLSTVAGSEPRPSASAAFYFINGRIVSLQATILPANGDYNTPEMGRFVDSVTFFTVLAPDDAIELPAPPKWRQARHLADEDLPWRRTGRQFKGGRNAQMDAGGQRGHHHCWWGTGVYVPR